MALCIIPARANSTRIPGKATKKFLGQPVIQYSLEVAAKLKEWTCVDEVIVTTDSDEIGSFAAKHGAVYYKRNPEYAKPDSPMIDAVLEVLEERKASEVVMLYACAPFIDYKQIIKAIDTVERNYQKVIFPVYKAREDPERAMIKDGKKIIPRYPEWKDTNSQGFRESYHSAGQWYVADVAYLRSGHTWTPLESGFIEIPQDEAVDIDTMADWEIAELLYIMKHNPEIATDLLHRYTIPEAVENAVYT